MEGTRTKVKVVYNRETKTSKTRTFLWDNPELRRAFREATQKEKTEAQKAKAEKKKRSTASCSRRWGIGKSGKRENVKAE